MQYAHRYFVLYKPVNMVSQFVSPHSVRLLSEINFDFPPATHAIGRLDKDSEGLLLLTTNKAITGLLLKPPHTHKRTYHVLLKNRISEESLVKLRNGVAIQIKNGEWYTTAPAAVELLSESHYPDHPVNPYIQKPSTWLSITLMEGKYHQIRKMVKSIGHPCQRLIRVSIEDLNLGAMQPGEIKEIPEAPLFKLLHLPL